MHPHRQFNAFPLTDTGTQAHAQAHTGATGYRVPKGFLPQWAARPQGIPSAKGYRVPKGFLHLNNSATATTTSL